VIPVNIGGGTTVTVTVELEKFTLAVKVTVVRDITGVAVIGNDAVVAFWGTVTVGPFRNCTLGSLLIRLIAIPPGGPGLESDTVPIAASAVADPPLLLALGPVCAQVS
jgi:hypothetical protein